MGERDGTHTRGRRPLVADPRPPCQASAGGLVGRRRIVCTALLVQTATVLTDEMLSVTDGGSDRDDNNSQDSI